MDRDPQILKERVLFVVNPKVLRVFISSSEEVFRVQGFPTPELIETPSL